MATSDRQNPAAVQRAIFWLPRRTTSAPHSGIAVTLPIAVPNSATPNAPSPRRSAAFTLAMRDTHVETTRPCTRKHAITPQNARRRPLPWLNAAASENASEPRPGYPPGVGSGGHGGFVTNSDVWLMAALSLSRSDRGDRKSVV